jgi:hypothetical protein
MQAEWPATNSSARDWQVRQTAERKSFSIDPGPPGRPDNWSAMQTPVHGPSAPYSQSPVSEKDEVYARLRAKRQALLLMIASSIVSIVLIGGVWFLVRWSWQ